MILICSWVYLESVPQPMGPVNVPCYQRGFIYISASKIPNSLQA